MKTRFCISSFSTTYECSSVKRMDASAQADELYGKPFHSLLTHRQAGYGRTWFTNVPSQGVKAVHASDFYNGSVLVRHQVGKGALADWFRGAFSYIRPILTRGFQAVGKEAMHSGSKLLTELADAPTSQYKDIVKSNLKEGSKRALNKGVSAMVRRQQGAGKRKNNKRRAPGFKSSQSRSRRRPGNKTKRGRGRTPNKKKSKSKSSSSRRSLRHSDFQPDIFG